MPDGNMISEQNTTQREQIAGTQQVGTRTSKRLVPETIYPNNACGFLNKLNEQTRHSEARTGTTMRRKQTKTQQQILIIIFPEQLPEHQYSRTSADISSEQTTIKTEQTCGSQHGFRTNFGTIDPKQNGGKTETRGNT